MINKELLLNIAEQRPIRGIFGNNSDLPIIYGDFIVEKHPRLDFIRLRRISDDSVIGIDHPAYITGHNQELLDINFDSALIIGLGIGVIPYIIQEFCPVVDVVEIEQDIINCVNQFGHLDDNVSLINGDIETYIPTRNYDIIILDIWYGEISEELTNLMIEKYKAYLNSGGFIYIPINSDFREDRVKIYNS